MSRHARVVGLLRALCLLYLLHRCVAADKPPSPAVDIQRPLTTITGTSTSTVTATGSSSLHSGDSIDQKVSLTSTIPTSSSSRTPTTSLSISTISPGTCAYASINYVTRRPPSQCYTQSRPSPTSHTPASTEQTTTKTPSNATSDSHLDTNHTPSTSSELAQDQSTNIVAAPTPVLEGANVSSVTLIATTAQPSKHAPEVVAVEIATVADTENESPLDHAKFLSFEDWKKQNLPHVPDDAKSPPDREPRSRPGTDSALDGLGDDGEIVLDFSGFSGSLSPGQTKADASTKDLSPSEDSTTEGSRTVVERRRPRDAGKTCKERSNYASFDCGASVLKHNPQGKKSSSILVENKDSYMLNECSADNKFLIVELCDEIKIDTIVLANFEFFSSIFRTFGVSVSDRYPVRIDKWKDIGTFEARNTRDIQAFLVEKHDGFARYVRIEFMTHYGSEYYCPVSLFRVHGVTAFEEYKLEQLSAEDREGDDEGEEEVVSKNVAAESSLPSSAASEVTHTAEKEEPDTSMPAPAPVVPVPDEATPPATASELAIDDAPAPVQNASRTILSAETCPNRPVSSALEALFAPKSYKRTTSLSLPTPKAEASSEKPQVVQETSSSTKVSSTKTSSTEASSTRASVSKASSMTSATSSTVAESSSSTPNVKPTSSALPKSSTVASSSSDKHSDISVPSSSTQHSATEINMTSNPAATASPSSNSTTISAAKPSQASPTALSSSVTAQQARESGREAPRDPPTQESFFKSIHKRLQHLEGSSTLSLQYIESQSALLRDAFEKVEKRQVAKTTTFLSILNTTVAAELTRFQSEYEQLWQSTIMELASQRDEGRRERELLGERVRMLAEEMVSQKRLMAAQATILLLCLVLVVFAKIPAMSGVVDTSLMQGMQEIIHKGKRRRMEEKGSVEHPAEQRRDSKWRWESPWATPARLRRSFTDGSLGPTEGEGEYERRGSGASTPRAYEESRASVEGLGPWHAENVRPQIQPQQQRQDSRDSEAASPTSMTSPTNVRMSTPTGRPAAASPDSKSILSTPERKRVAQMVQSAPTTPLSELGQAVMHEAMGMTRTNDA